MKILPHRMDVLGHTRFRRDAVRIPKASAVVRVTGFRDRVRVRDWVRVRVRVRVRFRDWGSG